ncbi:MAG TPA: D-glucuronyl C5-epimerase family protein [Candidatus Marinimicrobia bacterium]|nr:D-glucuronyl C5-epimerase family protein [Candidatus Neomarinimicrobiota bacterium]
MTLKKKWFMLKKLGNDIFRSQEIYEVGCDLTSEKLGNYYFIFEEDFKKLNKLLTKFDQDGIPLNTSYIDVETPRLHYYPISIGQYGLAVFHSFLKTGQADKRAHFLRIADWFAKNAVLDEKLGAYWLTDVPKPEYQIEKPWKSAFAQSRAISVLLRAWQLTGNSLYLEMAAKALQPFQFDITEGGVTANLKIGWPFYEEYVATEPTMVLDGHIFSLFGIFDFVRSVTQESNRKAHESAQKLFEEGVESLLNWLPEYDMGFWVRFNFCQMKHYPRVDPCTIGYLRLIVAQLKILYHITGRANFLVYSEKFSKYDRLVNILRMYLIKHKALKKLNRI